MTPLDGFDQDRAWEAIIDGNPNGPIFATEAGAERYRDLVKERGKQCEVFIIPLWKEAS
jgi:hypothetical protein